MTARLASRPRYQPALRRLAALAPLDDASLEQLASAMERSVTVRSRREVMAEGAHIQEPRLIVTGWAARVRLLADGRRQFLSFLLPGDLIGLCLQDDPLATSSVTALGDVTLCPVPTFDEAAALRRTYAMSLALEEAYLLEHIARLGRLNALERIVSLFLELHERLALNGMAQGGSFAVPLTQEILADALGLTSVHVNRMLQQARRSGDLDWQGGRVTLSDPVALARWLGRHPVRVSACGTPYARE